MFIKHGKTEIVDIIDDEDLTEEQKKSVKLAQKLKELEDKNSSKKQGEN